MANIAPQSVGTSLAPTFVAASAGGDTITNASGARFLVNNASGASINVTFTCQQACSLGLSTPTHDTIVAVAAGKIEVIPVPSSAVSLSTGSASVSYSATTSVTVAATTT